MKKLDLLIAQELLSYRMILQEAVTGTDLAQVRFTASTGQTTLERLKQNRIDAVLLSMHITEEAHLGTLQQIKKNHPHIHVIMVSDTERVNADATVQALQMGALDFILMQREGSFGNNVTKSKGKLQGLFTQIMTSNYTTTTASVVEKTVLPSCAHTASAALQTPPPNAMHDANLVVMAASTGGPAALKYLFKHLSDKIDSPILVVQHMPAEFTKKLAISLNKDSPLTIAEASDHAPIRPGEVLLGPGGIHLTVTKKHGDYMTQFKDSAPVNGVKPSADVLFESVAGVYAGKKILVVILTGMGSDGLAGVSLLKQSCDCYCLVQSEDTCVVYGMPGSIVHAGLADEIQDLNLIPERINVMARGRYAKW